MDNPKYKIIYQYSKCGLVITSEPINEEGEKFEKILIDKIGNNNRIFLPLILVSLPNTSYNENNINGCREYTIEIEKGEIEYDYGEDKIYKVDILNDILKRYELYKD